VTGVQTCALPISYEDRIRYLNLTTLETRRLRGDL